MIMKILSGILIVIYSISSVLVIAEEEWDSRHFNSYQWYANFNSYKKDCLVVPVKPKIFLADAECIESFSHKLNQDNNWIDWESVYGRLYPGITKFDKKNISFHEDLSENYDPSRRKVAVIISDKPCVPFSIKSRISKRAFDLYKERPLYYNKRYQIIHLNKNTTDIDFTNCSIPMYGSYRNISVDSCKLLEDKNMLVCSYNKTEFTPELFYQSPTITLFCNSKKNPDNQFLAGLVIRKELEAKKNVSTISSFEVINVSDMWKAIDEKWKELYPAAPEESKEFA